MRLDDFIRFTTRTLGKPDNLVHAPAEDASAPDPVRNTSLLRTLRLDKELLELARVASGSPEYRRLRDVGEEAFKAPVLDDGRRMLEAAE